MKLLVITLSLLTFCYGLPVPAFAESLPTEFTLPEGIAGQSYHANIETVLRQQYRLRLENDQPTSRFRWQLVSGELPQGLTIMPSGLIKGIPRRARESSYQFRVKVVDVTVVGMSPLELDFSLLINPPRIRLTQVRTPRLISVDVPIAARRTTIEDSSSGPEDVASNHLLTHQAETENTRRTHFAIAPTEAERVAVNPPTANTPQVKPDTSYDMNLIRPLLRKVKSPPMPLLPSTAPDPQPSPSPTYDLLRDEAAGDKIRGPATIKLKNLNILRYEIKVGKEVTFSAGPDLTLPFIPSIPSQPKEEKAGGTVPPPGFVFASAACANIETCFRYVIRRLNDIEQQKTNQVNTVITDAITKVNMTKADLEAVILASDAVLATSGPQGAINSLTPLVGSPGAVGTIDQALGLTWPDPAIDNLIGQLNILENDLLTLSTLDPVAFQAWQQQPGNDDSYDSVRARIDELQKQLSEIRSTSTEGVTFHQAQNRLRLWKQILEGVQSGGTSLFDRTVEVGCGFVFDSTKETKIKVAKRDRLTDVQATTEEVVTVVCSSPLSVSAGFGFSNVDEREFVFVPSVKSVTDANGQTTQMVINRFGFKNRSGFRTLPVVLLNTRIWEPNDTVALHASAGAAVDIKTGEEGTDLEYIVGPSLSLWRSMFITGGLHIGRVPRLAGGFQLDQEVPTGISAPPIEKSWKKGFVTTFTYKIR